MMKVAYFDCPTGIAGDMCLGALIDAGVPLDYLTAQLARLGISNEYTLRTETVHRNGQRATKLHVDLTTLSNEAPSSFSNDHPHVSAHPHSHSHHHHPTPNVKGDATRTPLHSTTPPSQTPKATRREHPFTPSRHLPDIETLIHSAQLTPRATEWSLAVFRQLAEAEGAVHGIPPSEVHFHEVGATDAIADIIGTCIGLDWLDIDQIYCSALPTGGGTVWAAHGRLPVPVPAVLHLFKMGQVPVYSNGIQKELVTPTGAAIATTLAIAFGSPPAMTIHSIGLGAGNQNLMLPNILRLWIGEMDGRVSEFRQKAEGRRQEVEGRRQEVEGRRQEVEGRRQKAEGRRQKAEGKIPHFSHGDGVCVWDAENYTQPKTQPIAILETHLDDLNPQIIGYLFDQLFAVGALDVFHQAIGMKKSRPGILLTVICLPEQMEICERVIYRETTTLGIRRRVQERSLLHRELHTVSTPYGDVSLKVASMQPEMEIVNVKPEYEDCARLAQQHQVSWIEVCQAALHHWNPEHWNPKKLNF